MNLWQYLLQENHYSYTFLQVRFFYWIRTWDDFAGKTSGSSSGPFRTEVQRKRNRFDEKATSCKSFGNHNCKYLLYHCLFTQSCLSHHNFESHKVFKIFFYLSHYFNFRIILSFYHSYFVSFIFLWSCSCMTLLFSSCCTLLHLHTPQRCFKLFLDSWHFFGFWKWHSRILPLQWSKGNKTEEGS